MKVQFHKNPFTLIHTTIVRINGQWALELNEATFIFMGNDEFIECDKLPFETLLMFQERALYSGFPTYKILADTWKNIE